MNYTALSTLLQQTTENYESTFVTNIPTFVRQAEQRIYNLVLFPALRKNVTGVLTTSIRYLSCPDDFLAVFALACIDPVTGYYNFLTPKDVSFIREAYPNPADVALPQYYGLFGPQSGDEKELTLLLGPTPDKGYEVELHYFYYPQSIVDAGNSWLGDNFDSVLLYGALVEAYIYMKGEVDVLKAYDQKFTEALAMAKRLGDGLERGDLFRNGQPKVPVA